MRLAVGLVLRRIHRVELRADPQFFHDRVDDAVVRRRRQRALAALILGELQRVLHARQRRAALAHEAHDLAHHQLLHLGQTRTRPRLAFVPVGNHFVDAQPHGAHAILPRELHAELGKDRNLGVLPQRLGVDEQPVHVEENGLDRHGAQVTVMVGRFQVWKNRPEFLPAPSVSQ